MIPIVVISLAFLGESLFGFGGGLIAIPLLGLILGVHDAVTFVLIFQLGMGVLLLKTYKQTDWHVAKPMTAGLLVGTVVGTILLSTVSPTFLLIFLSVSILAFLTKSFFFSGFTLGSGRSTPWGSVAGTIGGLFQGLIGTGGPVLTMYLSVATPEKQVMRATLIFLFFITSVVRVIISAWQGLFTAELLSLALVTLPFFFVAITVGQLVHGRINEKYYRIAVYLILFGSAISLLVKVFS